MAITTTDLFAPVAMSHSAEPRVIKLDGGELQRDLLPQYLRGLDDHELCSRLVVGYTVPLVLRTR